MKIFRISLGVLFIFLFICSVSQAELVIIGTATYDPDGSGPLEPVGDFKLIWDDYNNGRSVVWLDYTNEPLSWSDQNSWARGLGGRLTLNVDPAYSVVWDNSTLTGGWRLPHTPDGAWTVEEQGFEGDPDQDGIYNYTWGWNLADSALGHLFYVELNNVGLKDTNGNDNISYGFKNTGFFENISDTSTYWTDTEHTATGGDNAWVFSAEYGEKTIQLKTSANNGIALRNAVVSFNPERLDEVWNNGPFLSGNNSGWRVRPLVPGGSGIFADDFILNGQTVLREIILPTVHYLRDNDEPALEYINYWFFEDNDGSIGDVIFQGSDNSLEYKDIGVLGSTPTSGVLREYRIELPDVPDLNLATGHYWIGFQVSAEPETFSSLSGGSNVIGEYTGMMASTNDQMAQTPPFWRLFGSSSQSMGFMLLSDVESGPRTFSFTGTVNQIIEGDAGLAIEDDISGYFIVADQPNGSSGDGTTYALKLISAMVS